MTVREYGLYSHIQELTHTSGVLYGDDRELASHFENTDKMKVYRDRRSLIAKGWLVVIKPSERGEGGMYSPAQYVSLDHDKWAEKHPGACITCATSLTGEIDQYHPRNRPVSPVIHKSVGSKSVKASVCEKENRPVSPVIQAEPKATHTLSDSQKLAGKIEARICADFDTTGNPYLRSRILSALDSGRPPKDIYAALQTTKIEWNDNMVWKTLADNLPTALIQLEQAREKAERNKRQVAESTAFEQAGVAAEQQKRLADEAAELELVEDDLGPAIDSLPEGKPLYPQFTILDMVPELNTAGD